MIHAARLLLPLLLSAAPLPALADPAYLTAAGEATVSAAPDAVTINAGVTSSGKTAKEALNANSRTMSAVFAAVKALGIPDRNIRTTNLNLSPQYASIPAGSIASLNDRPVIGYRVSNTVNVTIDDTGKAGAVLDALVQAGANQAGGINYTLRNDKDVLAQARAAAVKDAFARAQTYAAAAGVALGPIHAITDTGIPTIPSFNRLETVVVTGSSIAPAPPLGAGEQSIRAGVTVSWEIK